MYTKQDVLARLRAWGISYDLIDHEPVRTMADSQALAHPLDGARCKSLLLRDKRGSLVLVLTTSDTTPIDLVDLRATLGCSRLSFASGAVMEQKLGVSPGALSPLALVNVLQGDVTFVMDSGLERETQFLLHPLENSSTVRVTDLGLHHFFEKLGVSPCLVTVRRRSV